jgi:hypothetical protein
MAEMEDLPRDLSELVVLRSGSLMETGDPWEPYRLVDPAGVLVAPVAAYLKDLQAAGRPATTQRSYCMALLRWFRLPYRPPHVMRLAKLPSPVRPPPHRAQRPPAP